MASRVFEGVGEKLATSYIWMTAVKFSGIVYVGTETY